MNELDWSGVPCIKVVDGIAYEIDDPWQPPYPGRRAMPTMPTMPAKRKRRAAQDPADVALNLYVQQRMSAATQKDMLLKVFERMVDDNTAAFFTPQWKHEMEKVLHAFFTRPTTVIQAGKK